MGTFIDIDLNKRHDSYTAFPFLQSESLDENGENLPRDQLSMYSDPLTPHQGSIMQFDGISSPLSATSSTDNCSLITPNNMNFTFKPLTHHYLHPTNQKFTRDSFS